MTYSAPYIEPALGPLGPIFVIYAAIAGVYAMIVWARHKRTELKHRITYLAGLSFWLLLGIHDGLASLGVPTFQYVMEYGFLGFAMAVLWVVFNSYLEIAAEEKYRVITEFANDCILVIQGGKMVFGNPSCCELIGQSLADLESRDLLDILTSEDRETILEHYNILLNGGRVPNPHRAHILRPDGNRRAVEISSSVIRYRNRSAVLAVMRDITERKQAEKALRESEERLRIAGKAAYDLIYEWDVTTDALEWFGDVDGLLGYREGEISRDINAWVDLINPEDQVKLTNAVELHRTSMEPIQYEYRIRHRDGTYRYWNDHALPLLDDKGRPYKWVGVCTDITERKWVEKALRASEEKYRTILKSIEDGYFEVDIAGNLIFFNDSLCEILGYPVYELMGMNNRQYTEEEEARKLYQTFNKVYITGNPDKGFDWEIIRKDGTKRVVESSVSLRTDAEGSSIGFRGIVRDISEKRRLEAQLQQVQRMESIGTLAGGIAHNFNNLLMGIMGYTSLMLLETDPDHPNYKRLKNIEKQVESGSKLTSQLLGYARKGSYEARSISLNQLIKETSDTFEMTRKEITVHRELSEGLHGIKADQGQIEQVLLNLYVNAADAMPGGGDLFLKTMNVADEDMTGKPYKVKPGGYVLLTVKDTGFGMDEETRERIFDPFFTTKGLASGTGLGMASAYGTIKGHGGYIDVESRKGKGTTFRIYLPAGERDFKEKEVSFDALLKGKGTILLVDDEEMVLDAGEQMLKNLGFEVLLAGDGRKAVDLYRKNQDKIDMVLLDMVMPVMGGGETFERLKGINVNVKILLSSGYSIEGEAEEILKRGCDAFIQKPFRLEKLSQKVREILERK